MVNLNEQNTIANIFVAELRDTKIQTDPFRFRYNLERLGEVMAYEISRTLHYKHISVETSLGIANTKVPADEIVLGAILRAGLPLHQGLLRIFDRASNAFVSAYRKHHKDGTFDIHLEYLSCPALDGAILIVSDPMLATGASMSLSTKALLEFGQPKQIHFATAIASQAGLDHMRRLFPDAYVWMAALDEELTGKAYIVPGLGDAGDLSYGDKAVELED